MLGIIFTVAKSFTSLDHLSEGGRYGFAPTVEGEDGSALVDDSCTLVDTPLSNMTLSIIKSIRTSSTTLSVALNASNIRTRG
jgi:hypothetical protein